MSFHAQPRATKDIDLFVSPDSENAGAVYAALTEFGAPLSNLRPDDFSDQGKFFRMGRDPVMVDVLMHIDGVRFDTAWERRIEAVIDATTGQTAFFLSSMDLIASKLAAARPQDLADVAALQEARRIKDQS